MDTGVLGSSTDEAGPLQPFTPNLTTAFFFVNETIDSPAYKVGHRQDIRSHLRKEVVRQFKQRHKSGGRGDAAQPKWRRLASQEVGKDVSMDPAGSESCPLTDEYSVQSRRGLCVKTGQLRVELIALKVV
jgi:hypothetical protein